MSLHLGNLSSHVRRDELERLFRRFGRCTVQIKDKYGFVVYEYPASAEKALKSLRGKRICGEPITLSWSNRQPQRPGAGNKSRAPPQKRYPQKNNRRLGFNRRRDFKLADGDGGKPGSSGLLDESTHHPDERKYYATEKDPSSFEDIHEAGAMERNHMADDRWEEQMADLSTENGLGNRLDFDRYEPYGDDRKVLDENRSTSPAGASLTLRKSQEGIRNEQIDHQENTKRPVSSKLQNTCYRCGELGHKMRSCPQVMKRHGSRSQGSLQPGSDDALMGQNRKYPDTSTWAHRRMQQHGDSPPGRVPYRGKGKEDKEKTCNRSEDGSPERVAQRTRSSLFNSAYAASRSRSQSRSRSLRSLSRSPSHSKSNLPSSRKSSPSSGQRSSTSRHSGSELLKSRSMSKSSSPTSLSIPRALGSHNQVHMNNEDLVNNTCVLNESISGVKSLVDNDEDNSQSDNMKAAMGNECCSGPSGVREEIDEDQAQSNCAANNSILGVEVNRSDMLELDNGDHTAEIMSPHIVKQTADHQHNDLVAEHMLESDSNAPMEFNPSNLMRMSSEEIYTALKHYGLEHPEEGEKDLPVEAYFGSARMWPWQIIYYRKLRKGPISTENYARRVAQNKEFGIIDKYIRASSGWGELRDGNH